MSNYNGSPDSNDSMTDCEKTIIEDPIYGEAVLSNASLYSPISDTTELAWASSPATDYTDYVSTVSYFPSTFPTKCKYDLDHTLRKGNCAGIRIQCAALVEHSEAGSEPIFQKRASPQRGPRGEAPGKIS